VSHIRQCQPFIGRCKTTTIFGRIQSIQDVVITALTRIYLDLVVPMLFHLLNKCSPHHNMTFFRQTQRFGYSPKPTMPIANNIHNSLNIWSNEFWHVIHRIRWIIISWNQDRLRNGNGVWIDECGEMPIRAPFLLGCEDFFGGEDWLYGCWESIVSHEDGILRVVFGVDLIFFSLLLWLVPFLEVVTTLWSPKMLTTANPLWFLVSFGLKLFWDVLEYHSTPLRLKTNLHYFLLHPYTTYVNAGVSHPIEWACCDGFS